MKNKWFKVSIITIIIFLATPTVVLGGSFVISLIQGKTADEAVQILAEQLDGVLDRLGIIEAKQAELEQTTQTATNEIGDLKDKNAELEESLTNSNVKIGSLETQNTDLQNKINCQDLIKRTPQGGNAHFINKDIVGYYNFTKTDLENSKKSLDYLPTVKENPTQENIDKLRSFGIIRDPNDNFTKLGWDEYWSENLSAQIKYDEQLLSEAQPLYDGYTAQCGVN